MRVAIKRISVNGRSAWRALALRQYERFSRRAPCFPPRHSREGGNPEGTRGKRTEPNIRSQVRIASDKSLPPLWGKARMGVTRASAALRAGDSPCQPNVNTS